MNPRLAAIPPSIIRTLHARKQPGDIDLGLGEPTLRPDPEPFEAAVAWVREHGCPYTSNAGDEGLRRRISRYYGSGDPSRVCVTVGSEEALYLAIKALLDPATDEVVVVSPAYLAYENICAMERIAVRTAELDPEAGFRPSAEAVLAAIGPSTRLVVLNSPCNPTGRVWPDGELSRLCAGLESASSSRPVYLNGRPRSAAELYEQAIIAASLSKSDSLTGLRLGWLYGPPAEVAMATRAHQLVNTAASTLSQRVALEALDRGGPGSSRPWYLERRGEVERWLGEAGIEHIPLEGAFYTLIRLPERLRTDSITAAERLLEEARVVTVPGIAFGAAGEGWLRISWVAQEEAVRDGVERIARFFDVRGG